jgi:mRNA-degrading endonuclease toxin of MazEF toxin-antitoxin module
MARVLRGEIRWADLDPTRGREQAGHRPVLVLSHDVFNDGSGTVIAAAMTSQEPRAGFPLTMEVRSARTHQTLMAQDQSGAASALSPACTQGSLHASSVELKPNHDFATRNGSQGRSARQVRPATAYLLPASYGIFCSMEPVVIYRTLEGDGATYALKPLSRELLKKELGEAVSSSPRIFIAHDTRADYSVFHADLANQIIQLLTGVDRAQLEKLGGVEFRDSRTDDAIPSSAA